MKDFVRNHQNEKGYLDTRNEDKDTIWCFYYEDSLLRSTDTKLLGIRVRNDDVEVLPDFWDLDIFNGSENLNESEFWHSLKDSDIIFFQQTLLNIAENIEQYV